MEVFRESLIRRLEGVRDDGRVKLLTGVRRGGKTRLLSALAGRLRESGAEVLEVDLSREGRLSGQELTALIKGRLTDQRVVTVDCLELCDDPVPALKELIGLEVDVYAALGAKLPLNMYYRLGGRLAEIRVGPLTLSQFARLRGQDPVSCWEEYALRGGMPEAALLSGKEREEYMRGLFDSICRAQLRLRHSSGEAGIFRDVLRTLAQTVGDEINCRLLLESVNSQGRALGEYHLSRYVRYAQDAGIAQKVFISRDSVLPGQEPPGKLYFTDLGFYTRSLSGAEPDPRRQLENALAIELLDRGVPLGTGSEVDTRLEGWPPRKVHTKLNVTFYTPGAVIQCVDDSNASLDRAVRALRLIRDGRRRIVVVPGIDPRGVIGDKITVLNGVEMLTSPLPHVRS